MKITAAQRWLSLNGGATAKRAEAMATALRGDGLLPKGGRGPHAPDADEAQVALLILAVAGAERVADAVPAALSLANLVDRHGATLIYIIAHTIGGTMDASAIRHIRVAAHIPMAEITYRHSEKPDTCERFFAPELWAMSGFKPEATGQGYVGPIGHIGGAVLAQMAIEFAASKNASEDMAAAV